MEERECGISIGQDKKQTIPDRNMNKSKDKEVVQYRVFFKNNRFSYS